MPDNDANAQALVRDGFLRIGNAFPRELVDEGGLSLGKLARPSRTAARSPIEEAICRALNG